MTNTKKVLIFTFDAGFGHRRAAIAIQKTIQEIHGEDVVCKIVNPIKEEGLSSIVYKSQVQYDDASRDHRDLYGAAFGIINHYPISLIADHAVTQLLIKEVTETILAECPDGIISTFPLYSTAIKRILFLLHLKIPFFTVVTDLDDVHRAWFHPGPNKYFVASNEVKLQAIGCRINATKIIVSGIPVDTRISSETRDKTTLREQLGWDPTLPTLLAIGSKRVQKLFEKLTAIEECGFPLQLCIVAGGDDSLYKTITNKDWKVPVHCYNFVDNIPELLLASDILIIKAGGLITSEGLASGLPMIIIDSITGQETGNVNYLLNNNAAVISDSAQDLQQTVKKWLVNDHHDMDKYAENAKRIGKPDAAYIIGNAMVNDMRAKKCQLKNNSILKRAQLLTNFPNLIEKPNQ